MMIVANNSITLSNVNDGTPGADGRTPYFHIAYANSSDSERNMNNWVLSDPAKQATNITYKDGVNTIDYKGVSSFEVFNFPVKAKKGQSFTFSFSWTQPDVQSLDGSTNGAPVSIADVPIEHGQTGRNVIYLGTSKTNSKLFTISGTATADTTYVSINLGFLIEGIQWQFKASFQQDFSQDPNNHEYMGTYTDYTQSDSLDPAAYQWSQIKGDSGKDGLPGKNGVGITATAVTYQASTSGTTAPTGTWLTIPPTVAAGKFLWTRMIWTYTDGTTETGYSVGHIGADGSDGLPGKAGADGKTPYFHTAWANSADGKTNFSTSNDDIVKWDKLTSSSFTTDTPEISKWSFASGVVSVENTSASSNESSCVYMPNISFDNTPEIISVQAKADNPATTYIGPWLDKHAISVGTDWANYNFSVVSTGAVSLYSQAPGVTFQFKNVSVIHDYAYRGEYTDYTVTDSTDPTKYTWVKVKGETGLQGLQGPQGNQGIQGPAGKSSYTHIAYGTSSTGAGFTQTPSASTTYIGMYVDFASTDSNDPTKYKWTLVKGANGANGTPGKAGVDGRTPYFHIAYANMTHVANENTSFTLSGRAIVRFGKYDNWVYKTFDAGTYTASNVTFGRDPYPGASKVAEVVNGFSVGQSANKSYLGTYTDFTQADSTNPSAYSWQLVQGPKGDTGKDGVAGKDGVGIKSTQIMYAQSTSGTTAPNTGWAAQVPTLIKGQYLWTQTTWVYTDNTGEAGYTVSYNAKDGNTGANGIAGKDGVGIKTTTITYATSTSGTTAPTSGWTVNPPATSAGQYIWTKTVWTYTDGTNETGYSVGKIGEKGDKGDNGTDGLPGKDGVGIKSTTVTYQASTSGTTAPTGTWLTIPPTVAAGKFLWTRMIWTYTDGTTETGYSVGHIGADGSDGLPGKPGADGRTPYFHQAWADSSDGSTNFSTDVSLGKKYLGTYTDYVVADSTDPTKYKWTELVGAIKIGGTNLLLNTGYLGANWGWQFSVTTTVEYNGYPSMMFTSSNQQLSVQNLALGKLQNSTQYTASFWAKADNAGDKAHTELWGAEGATDFVLTNYWVRYTAVLTSYSDANTNIDHSVCYFGVPSGNKGNVYIALPKLENGNKATDWSPAPEDNASASDLAKTNATVKTTVAQTAKNWSVLAQGLGGSSAGISVDGDGTVEISGNKLSIGSDLIAKDITGKNITGSTFANDTGTFSIDTDGNIKGAIISGSNVELTNLDTPDGTKKGFLASDGLLLQEDYKNATHDYDVVHTDVDLGWSGMFVRNNHKDGSYDYAGINAMGTPSLYVTRRNSNSQMTSDVSLDPSGISVTMLDSSGNYKINTLTPDKIAQLSNVGKLLWSGKTQLGDGQTITPSLPMTSCLNGWKIGIAIDSGDQFFWYYLAKERAIETPNLGHTIPLIAFNGDSRPMYLLASNTTLTGNSSANLKGLGAYFYIYEIRAF